MGDNGWEQRNLFIRWCILNWLTKMWIVKIEDIAGSQLVNSRKVLLIAFRAAKQFEKRLIFYTANLAAEE